MFVMGLKCDNLNCDFIDYNIKFEEYDKWLNKPCPKCGENLLTQQDYNKAKEVMAKKEYFSLFLHLFAKIDKKSKSNN